MKEGVVFDFLKDPKCPVLSACTCLNEFLSIGSQITQCVLIVQANLDLKVMIEFDFLKVSIFVAMEALEEGYQY